MPRLDRDPSVSGPIVRGFAAKGFVVEGAAHEALLLTPERADRWNPPALAELEVEHLAPLLALRPAPEFILLGTGAKTGFPPASLVRSLEALGVGLEAMDSRAAARTWGLLRGEGRWIAAALLPLG